MFVDWKPPDLLYPIITDTLTYFLRVSLQLMLLLLPALLNWILSGLGAEQWSIGAAGGDGWREPVALANKCGLCQVRAHVLRSCSPDCGFRSPDCLPHGQGDGGYPRYPWRGDCLTRKIEKCPACFSPCSFRLFLFGLRFVALFSCCGLFVQLNLISIFCKKNTLWESFL